MFQSPAELIVIVFDGFRNSISNFNFEKEKGNLFECYWYHWRKYDTLAANKNIHLHKWGFPRDLEIPLSCRFFAQITHRNCLKFMFTPSLPNHAGCQIDFSRNHAIIFTQFTFSRSKICPITPSRFPLGGPLTRYFPNCTNAFCSSHQEIYQFSWLQNLSVIGNFNSQKIFH